MKKAVFALCVLFSTSTATYAEDWFAVPDAPYRGDILGEARKYLGMGNPTGMRGPWCRYFEVMILKRLGYHPGPSGMALDALHDGVRLAAPQIGAVAVLRGHVGFVQGVDARGNLILISGNHGHRVGVGAYPRSRVVAFIDPR